MSTTKPSGTEEARIRIAYEDNDKKKKEYRFKRPIILRNLIKVFKIDGNEYTTALVSSDQTFTCSDDGVFDIPESVERVNVITQRKTKTNTNTNTNTNKSNNKNKKNKKSSSTDDDDDVDDKEKENKNKNKNKNDEDEEEEEENDDDDDDDDDDEEDKDDGEKKGNKRKNETFVDDFEILDDDPEMTPSDEPNIKAQLLYKAAEIKDITGVKLGENAKYLYQEGTSVINSITAYTRNPWTNCFTWLEKDQMTAIQMAYTNYISSDLPHELRTKEDGWRPEATTVAGDLKKSPWLKSMGDGPLSRVADDIITHACSYQEERYNRGVSYGYLDDPTNLFWDEFKRWAINDLSKAPADEKTCEVIKKRIKYMNSILNSDKFPPGSKSQTTMKMVILTVKKILEDTAIPTIIQEILNNSVREHISQLSKQSKHAMVNGIYFLYHSVRCAPNLEKFCFDFLQNPKSKIYQLIESTTSGKLLINMANSSSVSSLLDNVVSRKTQKVDTNKPKPLINPKFQNSFINENGLLNYPSDFVLTGKDLAQVSQKSGILVHLLNQEFLNNYFYLHGLIIELSSFIILLDDAKKLSGTGGELLVYGIANKQMVNMMEAFLKILKKIDHCVKQISEETQSIHNKMIMRELPEDRNWTTNYQSCNHYHERLTKSLESALTAAEIIRKKASEINIQERLISAKQATEKFAQDASLLFERACKMSLISDTTTPLVSFTGAFQTLSIEDSQKKIEQTSSSSSNTNFNANQSSTTSNAMKKKQSANSPAAASSSPLSKQPQNASSPSRQGTFPQTNPWNESDED